MCFFFFLSLARFSLFRSFVRNLLALLNLCVGPRVYSVCAQRTASSSAHSAAVHRRTPEHGVCAGRRCRRGGLRGPHRCCEYLWRAARSRVRPGPISIGCRHVCASSASTSAPPPLPGRRRRLLPQGLALVASRCLVTGEAACAGVSETGETW